MDLLKTFFVYFAFHNSSLLFFRYLKGRWCILVCYDVTTKYPVYCVLMDNINGLQLYLLLLYYDFNKCYYYVDDKESLFYCQIKIKIFSRQMLSHVHCFFCFPWGFGGNLHVNISLFRINYILLSWFEIFRFIKWGFRTLDDHQAPNAIVRKQKRTQKFLFLNCKSVEMKLCLKLHCSLCVLIIPTNTDAVLFFYLP